MSELTGSEVVVTEDRSPEGFRASLKLAESLWMAGEVTPREYWRMLVGLAARTAADHQDVEQALVLLNRCPEEYFRHWLMDDLRADEAMAASVLKLVAFLETSGIMDVTGVVTGESKEEVVRA